MKFIKKFTSIILSFALFVSLVVSMGQPAEASASVSALKKIVPSKVRIMPYNEYAYGDSSSTTAIFVPYASYDNCIANIKVSNKSLKAKQTKEMKSDITEQAYPYYGLIGLYGSKEGTYKVSFDVLKKKGGAKLYSKTVTVYVKSDSPFASVKYAGKSAFSGIQPKAKGKFSVKMNKGYKLKSIRVGTYTRKTPEKTNYSDEYYTSTYSNESSELTYKTIKNNSVITLSSNTNYNATYSYSKSDYSYSIYRYLSDNIFATTLVEITYIDKYTKQPCIETYSLQKLVK